MDDSGKSGGQPPTGRRGPKTGSNVAARTIPSNLDADPPAVVPSEVSAPAASVSAPAASVSAPAASVSAPAASVSAPAASLSAPAESFSAPAESFGPGVVLDACRRALAPTFQEALKAIERFSRYQYSVAGDYLEWGVAQASANLTFGTPAEQVVSQTAVSTQFAERLQGRVQEFVNLAGETRASFNQLLGEATATLAETIKQSA
jgi:hypothetical protein